MGKKYCRAFLVLLFLHLSLSAGWSQELLTILHINDFHGRIFPYVEKGINPEKLVGGAAYLAEMIKGERDRNPKGVLLLSAGDMFQGTPVSNVHQGKPVLDFMNMVRFDVMALGNHEFDWGREVLAGFVGGAHFPMLSANIVDKTGAPMPGVKAYTIVERKGIKIGIIGVTTPQIAHMANAKSLRGLNVKEPAEILPCLIKEVKTQGVQLVVLLSHLGYEEDMQLAKTVEGIDVIVGGHSHTTATDAVRWGQTIVVQAGYNGTHLGILDLVIDDKTGRIVQAREKGELRLVVSGPGQPFDKDVAPMVETYGDSIKAEFQRVVGEAGVDLIRRGEGESNLGNVITDAFRESTGADIGFHNNGAIRADILKGRITMEQVYMVLPFDNLLVSVTMKGADITELLEGGARSGKGMLQVSGMKIVYEPQTGPGRKVASAWVNGQPLDLQKDYRVVTNDFLAAGGDRFTIFGRGRDVAYGGEVLAAVVEYIKKHSPLHRGIEGRITVRGQ